MRLFFLGIFILLLSFSEGLDNTVCSSDCSVANCAQCTNATCTSCFQGYSLSSNACTINTCSVANCSLCDSQGACIQCVDLYSTYNSSAAACIQTCPISNCLKCKSGSKSCEQCSTGFARYQWNDQCIPTPIANC
jgi:hypothetical protein